MLEGKCPKCGYRCIGWALRFPRHQTCPKCGTGLDVFEDGRKILTGPSLFDTNGEVINTSDQVTTSDNSES